MSPRNASAPHALPQMLGALAGFPRLVAQVGLPKLMRQADHTIGRFGPAGVVDTRAFNRALPHRRLWMVMASATRKRATKSRPTVWGKRNAGHRLLIPWLQPTLLLLSNPN